MRGRAAFAMLGLAVALVASGSGGTATRPEGPAPAPAYGLVSSGRAGGGQELVRLDPRTLVPLAGRRVELGDGGAFAGRSPDGRFAAFFDHRRPSLRIVDLERMRVAGDVRLAASERARVRAGAWLTADRVAVVVQRMRGSYDQIVAGREVALVDPLARRVVSRARLPADAAVQQSASGGDKLVLLLGRGDRRDSSLRLVAIDGAGSVSDVSVGLRSGGLRTPSLVVDPAGRRAFVIAAGEPVADVDLATMEVTSRPVRGGGAVFALAAAATRHAIWVDGRTLAVTGSNIGRAGGVETSRPVGLALVDTATWRARLVDRGAGGVAASRRVVVAYGIRTTAAPPGQKLAGIGLRAYTADGKSLWRRLEGEPVTATAFRDVALVHRILGVTGEARSLVVDLDSGRRVRAGRPGNLWVLPDAPEAERALAEAASREEPVTLDGDGLAFTGAVRGDVSRVIAVLVDGTEREVELQDGTFSFRADSPERSARQLRAYAGDELVSTVALPVRCGGAAGPCAASRRESEEAAYALLRGMPATLVRVEPRTLAPIGRRLAFAGATVGAYARSPDGRHAAFGGYDGGRLEIVDLERMRRVRTVELGGARTMVRALAWLSAERVVAVVQRMSETRRYVRERTAVFVDPSGGEVVARRQLTNKLAVAGAVQAAGRLVLMLRSSSHKGSTVTLAVADADGSVRTRRVEVGQRGGVLHDTRLAVAPGGERAFLLGWALRRDTPPVIEVELDTLTARSHPVRVGRAGDLEPAALSSLWVGAIDDRYVAAIGAVSAGGGRPAAGVFTIDTHNWTATRADPRATYFRVHGGRLLTYGPSSRGAELGRRSGRGSGITAYEPPARRLYHLYANRPFSRVEVAGSYGHVLLGGNATRRLVFDARAGRPLGTLPALDEPVEVLEPPPAAARVLQRKQQDPFRAVSNRGTRVRPRAEKPGEREMTPRDVFLLRRAEGRAVYRIGGLRPGYSACFATGPAAEVGRLGQIACGRGDFPSRARPLFDLSSVGMERGEERPRFLRVEGVAADAVAEIGLTDAAGDVVDRIPVVENVYLLAAPPAEATAMVAYDRDGTVVHRAPGPGAAAPAPPPATPGRLAGFRLALTLPDGWTGEIRRSSAGPARALVIASNRRPARDPQAITLALTERDPRSRPAFPRVARPPQISAADVRRVGAYGRAERRFTLNGRQFTLQVGFGTPRPAPAVLREVNGLLGTLRVGAIAVPPAGAPAGRPLQRASADGVTVEVFRSGVVRFRLDPASRAYRLSRDGKLTVACITFDSVAPWETNEWWASRPLAPVVQLTAGEQGRPQQPYETLDPATEARPPFDGCQVSGSYGRRWGSSHGYRSPAEIPFTARGKRFFEERELARKLAYFVRSPAMSQVRTRMKRGAAAPPAAAVAARYSRRDVVAVSGRGAVPRGGRIGVWTRGTAVEAAVRTSAGKLLYVMLKEGRIAAHNLHGLAFVF